MRRTTKPRRARRLREVDSNSIPLRDFFALLRAFAVLFFLQGTLSAQSASQNFYNVMNYGGVADGQTKCTQAIAKAIDEASSKGGGTVYFPAGTYLTGPIHLKSNITLNVDAGATIKFSNDLDDYLPMVPSRYEGVTFMNFSPLIYANNVQNIAIVGRGTLDGQGQFWWNAARGGGRRGNAQEMPKWQEEFTRLNQARFAEVGLRNTLYRPPFIQPYQCSNVLIEGVTIKNSPFWTITPVFCEQVNIRGVIIDNPVPSPNTDGINPDSCHVVHISDCYINAGDDCITIKSGKDEDGRKTNKPAEDYTITNCTMAAGHGGVSIGSEMSGGVKNISISNCVFDGTDTGIRLKSTRGRGGIVEDIRVSNIVMRNIRNQAFILTMFYTRVPAEPVSERTPIFRNIHFSGITGDANIACELTGLSEMPIENVTFNDVQLHTKRGFTITDAKGIQIRNLLLDTEQGPLIKATTTDGLDISGLKTTTPHADASLIELSKVQNAFVHGCVAPPGTETFLSIDDASADQLTMEANQLKAAKTALKKSLSQ